MPLQVGVSSARLFASGFAQALGGLLGGVFCASMALDQHRRGQSFWFTAVAALVPFAYVCFGVLALRRSLRTRASDVLLGAEGVRVEGGPHHGARLAPGVRVERRAEGKKTSVVLVGHDQRGRALELATSLHDVETRSIEALATTLNVVAAPAGPTHPASAEVLRCGGCGAPLVPEDAAQIRCRFCAAPAPVPEPLRGRLRAAAALARSRPEVERLVRELLAQPGARSVVTLSAVLAAVVLCTPGLSIAALAYQHLTQDSVRVVTTIGLLELPFFTAAGAYLLLRARIVDRVALGLLTLDLSARRDARGTLVCHACGGPLPGGAQGALARCVYCHADNVLGVDLRRPATATRRDQEGLVGMLRRRRRERLRWLGGGVVALGLLVHAGSLLAQGFETSLVTRPTEHVRIGADVGELETATHSAAASLRSDQVAYVERYDGGRAALRLLVDGHRPYAAERRTVTEAPGLRDPAWLGSRELLFLATRPDGRTALRRVPAGGGSPVEVHVGDDLERPSASADGTRIVVAERAGDAWEIVLLEGGTSRRLAPGRMPNMHPFEPRVVFIQEFEGLTKPVTLDLSSKDARPRPVLAPNRWRYADPVFAPCDEAIVVATNANWDVLRTGTEQRTRNLILVPPQEGAIVWLTTGNATARRPSWALGALYFDTDGHSHRRERVYRLDGSALVGGLYSRRCKRRIDALR